MSTTPNPIAESKQLLEETLADLSKLGPLTGPLKTMKHRIELFLANYDTRFPDGKFLREEAAREARSNAWAKKRESQIFHVRDANLEGETMVIVGISDACGFLNMRESTFRARLSGGGGCFTHQGKIIIKVPK